MAGFDGARLAFLGLQVRQLYIAQLSILRCPVCRESLHLAHDLAREDDGEVRDAILGCKHCKRWFRIEDGIADLVRDGLREVEQDRAFLRRYQGRIANEIVDSGTPFGLEGATVPVSEEDQRIIDEGRHWGRFMRRFWDVGDRSIFDLRVKGSHPSFFVKGVLEPDDRDLERRWSFFPKRTGDLLFARLYTFHGRRGIDVGCGGGQFGLEAARQGVDMIGFDPSFEEVWLARKHAREYAIMNIDYFRADPADPPFAPKSFGLMMAKDSLHHVPNLKDVFPRLLDLLDKRSYVVIHEHVDIARRKNRLMERMAKRLLPRIQRRYPSVEVPPELLTDSANEDVSAGEIRGLLEDYFTPLGQSEDLFFAHELEMYIYYAFGKRKWPAACGMAAGKLIERLLLLRGDRQHLSFVGIRREEE